MTHRPTWTALDHSGPERSTLSGTAVVGRASRPTKVDEVRLP